MMPPSWTPIVLLAAAAAMQQHQHPAVVAVTAFSSPPWQAHHLSRRRRLPTTTTTTSLSLSSSDIQTRLKAQMAKLQERDRSSREISPDELDVVYEDEHIAVVNKPSGVLTVPGKESNPSLAASVFAKFGSESGRMDKMVVHRLGMDTSGLVVFARTDLALRSLNSLFRTRKVTRKYEALVCGTVTNDSGTIDLPLMRDYENPPYMRVSTDERQRALIGLDPEEVGRKVLEGPKASVTEYEVLSRESLFSSSSSEGDDDDGTKRGMEVTRLSLTSVSGRTHQLNVHCAAIGHPIVGDAVYGIGGEAAPNGGLDADAGDDDLPEDRAGEELQGEIAREVRGTPARVHARSISFEHPSTGEALSFECDAAF